MDLAIVAEPFWRVTVVGVDILQSNGEMDQEQVEVVDSPKAELMLRKGLRLHGVSARQ